MTTILYIVMRLLTCIIGEVCTLLASRRKCIIWRVCAGAEERCDVRCFQHPRHAAVICTSEFKVTWPKSFS